MTSEGPQLVAGQLYRPAPVEDGEVLEIDTGFERTIVLKVQRGDEIYYETYGLVDVERESTLRPDER